MQPPVIQRPEFVYRLKTRKLLLAYRAATSSPLLLYRAPGRYDQRFVPPFYPRIKRRGYSLLFANPATYAIVPDVTGVMSPSAQAIIVGAGFANGALTNSYSSTVPEGEVISQNPPGNTIAAIGTTVFLTISVGPAPDITAIPAPVAKLPPIYMIPLQVGAPQTFSITLNGKAYQFTLKYRNVDQGGWVLDVQDSAGNDVVNGIPLVTGANLLAQYAYLGFGGSLWVQTPGNADAVPTFENLGQDALFFWVPDA